VLRGEQRVARGVCVPETSSMSCDLRVLVDDAADQIAAAGFKRVKVDDSAGQRFEWCGLAAGTVRPMLVVVGLVLSQHGAQC
jgi:hypothetical protein